MYVGNNHTNTSTASKIKEYACDSCGHTAKALVSGIGQGQGTSPYFMDETGAKKTAEKRANKSAIKNVDDTFLLAKCPNCGKQNETNVKSFWKKQISQLIKVALFFIGIGVLAFAIAQDEVVLMIFGAMVVPLLALIYKMHMHWKWKTADNRIQFLEE